MLAATSLNMLVKASGRVCMSCGSRLNLAPASFVQPRQRSAHSRAQRACVLPARGDQKVMQRLSEIQTGQEGEFDDFDDDFADAPVPVDEEKVVEQVVQPRGTGVQSAKYFSSSVTLASCPPPRFPEFAVIGRSNVGKSSLINMLVRDSKLALTSKQPGKTKCINHFLINDAWWLVDLPGYGYAKRGKEDRLTWNTFTKEYFLERETLVMVFLLVDGSIPTQDIDMECAIWLAQASVPFSVVFTKVDKKKKKGPTCAENMDAFCRGLEAQLGDVPDCFVTSSSEGKGRTALMEHLSVLRQLAEADGEADA